MSALETTSLLLSTAEVCDLLNVSRTTLWKLERTTDFPRPIAFNARLKRWKRKDIEAYVGGKEVG